MRRRASASVDELAALIASGCRCVFITGAGLSAASGIPTFRGASDSVWSVTSAAKGRRATFLRDPLKWYNDFWLANFPHSFTQRRPNAGHEAIAAVAAAYAGVCVITQNVDALHQQTATRWPHDERLIEVHGRLGLYKCVHGGSCRYAEREAIPAAALLPDGMGGVINAHAGGRDGGGPLAAPPVCPGCGQPVPPMALMFDEQYESHNFYAFQKALDWMAEAAVFVFVGTSYAVTITTLALDAARERRVPVFDFNLHPSLKDSPALDVRSIDGPAEIALPQLVEKLRLVTRSKSPVTSLSVGKGFASKGGEETGKEEGEGTVTTRSRKSTALSLGGGPASTFTAAAAASSSDEDAEAAAEEREMAPGAELGEGGADLRGLVFSTTAAAVEVGRSLLDGDGFSSKPLVSNADNGGFKATELNPDPFLSHGEQSPQKRPRLLPADAGGAAAASAAATAAAGSFRFGFDLEHGGMRGGGGGAAGGSFQLPSGPNGGGDACSTAAPSIAEAAFASCSSFDPSGDGQRCTRESGLRFDLDPILPVPLGRGEVRAVLSSRFSRRAHPDPEVEARVEQLWQEQVRRDGRVFNGSKFRLAGYRYAAAAAGTACSSAGSAAAPAAAAAVNKPAAFAGIRGALACDVSSDSTSAISEAATGAATSAASSSEQDFGTMATPDPCDSAALTLHVALTDYRGFRGTNWSPEAARLVADGWRDCGDGGAYLSQKLGVGAVVELADGESILLIRRSRHVAEGKGAVDVPGGHPEPERLKLTQDILVSLEAAAAAGGSSGTNANTASGPAEATAELARLERASVAELFDSVVDEIVDETNVPRSQISDPLLLGIVAQKNSAGAPSAAFWVRCTLPEADVLRHYREGPKEAFETTGLIVASATELEQAGVEKWFQGKGLEPTPSCEGAIELWLRQRRKRGASPVK